MLVDVTDDDILNGYPGVCGLCPIARRLEALTGERWFVTETNAVPLVHLRDPDYPVVLLPEEARAWVLAYDRGDPVRPFQFLLPVNDYVPPFLATGEAT